MAVTLKDVAELAGVSRQSVSRILGDRAHLFREETRERVRKAADELGYRPNAAARAIATSRTRQVGVLIANHPADPFTHMQSYFTILGINMGLEEADHLVSLVRIGGVNAEMSQGSRVFREHILDGIIVTTHVSPEVSAAVERLVPTCIWLDTEVYRPTMSIRRDERHAAQEATRAAIRAGYRRLLWWGESQPNSLPHYSDHEREHGFLDACAEAGIVPARIHSRWDWNPQMSEQLEPYMKPGTAIVTYDVHRARLVWHAALTLMRRPGEDFGTICCEDTPEIGLSWPGLARMEFDRLAMGRRAAEMMLSALADPSDASAIESLKLRSRLIEGQTLGPAGVIGRQASAAPPVPQSMPPAALHETPAVVPAAVSQKRRASSLKVATKS